MNTSDTKHYLITGGTGFLGEKLIERLKGNKITVIARNEGKLIDLKQKYDVDIHCGDIADKFVVNQLGRYDGIFHLAAFKHVPLAEKFSYECINSNLIGSMNILELAGWTYPDFVIGISTDKAANVAGVYGATKLLMEKMFVQYESTYPDVKFRIVRYGNVIYSTGSVLCKWKELIKKGKDVVITDPGATRFFWTIDQAIDLIFQCLENAGNATPFVPEMKSIRMGDLLQAMIQKYAHKDINIKITGLQKGENKHERMLESGDDSSKAEKYSIEEIKEMI